MKTKHTPAPWRVEANDKHTSVESEYFTIATDLSNDDAALVAAAPDMLLALERIEVMLQSNRDAESDFLLTLIRPAIAKAKGE